jgi:predicted membrane-bound spermidine synthase
MSSSAVRYVIVAAGLATLGIQVLVPRILHPFFGSGTDVNAAVVGVALAGLALGYRSGGRPTPRPSGRIVPALLITAVYIVAVGILLRTGVADQTVVSGIWLVPVATALVGVPSFFLGTVSPLAIQALGDGHDEQGNADGNTNTSASVFAIGTAANVVGGLVSGFVLAPFVGISLSLIGFGVLLAVAAGLAARSGATDKADVKVKADAGARADADVGVRADADTDTEGSAAPEPMVPKPITGKVYGFLALAFYSGVASVALEVNASRMLASNFGPTTGLWAAILAVSLGGLAIGYRIGGSVALPDLEPILPGVVLINAAWLIGATWAISVLQPGTGVPVVSMALIATLAFGPPFVLFGMESQILVGAVWQERQGSMSASASLVFAISSVGGIIGALAGIAFLIPILGVSGLVRLFLAGYLVVLAAVWSHSRKITIFAAVLAAIMPLPSWTWADTPGRLVAQEEGRFQTIRVYTDDASYLRFHLGPTYESEVWFNTGEPRFGYATTILQLAGDLEGKRVLVIGGAGHALAHGFENRGATVTEVELDPIVRDVSDRVFEPLEGETVVQDGRRYVTGAPSETFDIVIVDAFAGPRYVPPHLTTVEFFDQVRRVLKTDGTMYLNMISALDGPGSGPFKALSSSVATSFDASGYVPSGGNIVVVGSRGELGPTVTPVGVSRTPNTDDKNPMDILLETAG